jgi:pimeloyl-ACP methyl ester carboxylesterase
LRLYYEEAGEGDDILLIPGLGLSAACWSDIVDEFVARGYRVIRYDPRGAGRSDKPDRAYSGADVAADAVAVLTSAGSEAAHVIGVSMGGMIAQELVLRYPERVSSLVLTSTYGRVDDWSRRIFELRREIIERIGLETGFKMSFLFVFSPHAFRESRDVVTRVEQSVAHVDRAAFLRQLQFCLDHDALDRVKVIDAPTLVICGEFDLLASEIQSRELAEAVPGAQLITIPRGSHALLWEKRDEYVAHLQSFLAKVQTREVNGALRG